MGVEETSKALIEAMATPEPLPDEPGVCEAIPDEVYHQPVLGMVSKSALDQVNRSPAHYRAWLEAPSRDTAALLFGRLFHMAVLEPDRFDSTYAAEPEFGDCRRKDNRERRDAWRADHADRTPVSAQDYYTIIGMRDSVRRHPLASKMLGDGQPELTLLWKDAETGLSCKSRLDFYARRHAMIVDVKSTDDAREESFRKSIVKYGYHRQDALYRGAADALSLPIEHFVLMAVEKTRPFAVATYTLDADAIGRGYTSTRRNIDTLAECVAKDEWPAYPPGIRELELPPWAA